MRFQEGVVQKVDDGYVNRIHFSRICDLVFQLTYSLFKNSKNLQRKNCTENRLFAPCKGIQDNLDSKFHALDSGFQVLDSGFFLSGTWIPDSNH